MQKESGRAKREGYPLSVAILDIDFFKQVNDSYGHEAGDMALIHLAGILSKLTRVGDYVFRYGGEEFLIMLPETSLISAGQFCERCRQYIENSRLKYADHEISMTVSIGLSVFLPGEVELETVLKAADTALYQVKTSGRNRVCVSDNLDYS